MYPLITLAHGSRNPRASIGANQLTEAAHERLGGDVPEAVAAHLELTDPNLLSAAGALASAGHFRAVVVPLLFSGGFHAHHDVPVAVRGAETGVGLKLILAEPIGAGDDVAEVLERRIRTDAPAGAHVVLYSVGSADDAANERILDLAANTGRRSARSCQVITATQPGDGMEDVLAAHERVHVVPLFVSEGLLLDKLREELTELDPHGARTSVSGPLTTDLADVVVARYRAALDPADESPA